MSVSIILSDRAVAAAKKIADAPPAAYASPSNLLAGEVVRGLPVTIKATLARQRADELRAALASPLFDFPELREALDHLLEE